MIIFLDHQGQGRDNILSFRQHTYWSCPLFFCHYIYNNMPACPTIMIFITWLSIVTRLYAHPPLKRFFMLIYPGAQCNIVAGAATAEIVGHTIDQHMQECSDHHDVHRAPMLGGNSRKWSRPWSCDPRQVMVMRPTSRRTKQICSLGTQFFFETSFGSWSHSPSSTYCRTKSITPTSVLKGGVHHYAGKHDDEFFFISSTIGFTFRFLELFRLRLLRGGYPVMVEAFVAEAANRGAA